jgi:large subunit ribosomal protein L35
MPKLKSNRSLAKRVRVTKTGKVKRFRAGTRHLLAHKRSKRKRILGRSVIVAKVDERTFRKLLPYGR